MNTDVKAIEGLHGCYVRMTGRELRLDMGREGDWFRFLKAGFTEGDLVVVIERIQKGIREGARNPGALKFHNLVQQLDYFEEDLAEARACGRAKAPVDKGRAEVLKATGRSDATRQDKSCTTSGKVIESEAFRKFVDLKGKL